MERAVDACGLSDFGDHDDFRIGLRVVLNALDQADVAPDRRAAMHAGWIANLETRLRLVQLRHEHPEIADQSIEGPLAVIGLPRTGTTALVDLLAQDPAARAPLQWETGNLFPPSSRADWANDPRIEQLQSIFDSMGSSNPIVALGLHTYGATLPDECNTFLALDFWSPNMVAAAPLPAYNAWLRFATLPHPYRTHRWVLQHLQAHGPSGRWTLKSPFHVFDVPGLLAEYPDAMLVQTHRDPAALMASMAGLYSTIRGEGPGDPRREETGRELLELWGTGLQRCLAARQDPAVDGRVLDVSHRAMIDDPIGTLRSVYDHFALSFDSEAERRARAWAAQPSQHLSTVRFDLADFGLDEDAVDAGFGSYRQRFAELF
jgi:hypothetical protein